MMTFEEIRAHLLQSLVQMFLALTLHECGHLLAAAALRRPAR